MALLNIGDLNNEANSTLYRQALFIAEKAQFAKEHRWTTDN